MSAKRFPLTPEGIKQALEHANSPEARAEYIAGLRAQLAEFEQRYQRRSEFLREALRSGELKETLDITEWALVVDALAAAEKAAQKAARRRTRRTTT